MNLHYLIRGLVLWKDKVGMPIYWHSDRLIVLFGVLPDSNNRHCTKSLFSARQNHGKHGM